MASADNSSAVVLDVFGSSSRSRTVSNVVARLVTMEDVAAVPIRIENRSFLNCRFEKIQLRPTRFYRCSFKDVSFDRCELRDLRMWDCEMRSCSFNGSKLRGAGIGGVDNNSANRFTESSFAGADLRECDMGVAEFRSCDFTDAKLQRSSFPSCVLKGCTFAGKLTEVDFGLVTNQQSLVPRPVQIDQCDFSEALLKYCRFGWIQATDVRWPPTSHCWVFDGRQYDDLVQILHDSALSDPSSAAEEGYKYLRNSRVGNVIVLERCSFVELIGTLASEQLVSKFDSMCLNH